MGSKVRFKTKLGTLKLLQRGTFGGMVFWKVLDCSTKIRFIVSQRTLIKNLIKGDKNVRSSSSHIDPSPVSQFDLNSGCYAPESSQQNA